MSWELYMDAMTTVRELVEDELGQLDDEGWDWLVGVHFLGEEPAWDVAAPEVMAQELLVEFGVATRLVNHVDRARATSSVPSVPEGVEKRAARARLKFPRPPEWWTEQARKVMEDHRGLQKLVWSQLEMQGPLALSDVESFLLGARQLERGIGQRQVLIYPDPASLPGLIIRREMEVRSGWTRAELKAAGVRQRTQPLSLISRSISSLGERTGCSEEEVCAFLMCDVPLRLPWVSLDYAPASQIARPIILTIGTPDVPADDVRRAYLIARDFLRSLPALRKGESYRRSRGTTWELVAFVEKRRPEMSWDAIHREWTNAHPKGSKGHHSTMNSMRSSYYRAPMKRKKVAQ